jgi:putative flippase GtrA
MKNIKLSRNLWLFAGFCFFVATILQLTSDNGVLVVVVNACATILMFINAYIYHKKVINDKKD